MFKISQWLDRQFASLAARVDRVYGRLSAAYKVYIAILIVICVPMSIPSFWKALLLVRDDVSRIFGNLLLAIVLMVATWPEDSLAAVQRPYQLLSTIGVDGNAYRINNQLAPTNRLGRFLNLLPLKGAMYEEFSDGAMLTTTNGDTYYFIPNYTENSSAIISLADGIALDVTPAFTLCELLAGIVIGGCVLLGTRYAFNACKGWLDNLFGITNSPPTNKPPKKPTTPPKKKASSLSADADSGSAPCDCTDGSGNPINGFSSQLPSGFSTSFDTSSTHGDPLSGSSAVCDISALGYTDWDGNPYVLLSVCDVTYYSVVDTNTGSRYMGFLRYKTDSLSSPWFVDTVHVKIWLSSVNGGTPNFLTVYTNCVSVMSTGDGALTATNWESLVYENGVAEPTNSVGVIGIPKNGNRFWQWEFVPIGPVAK
jgi:hypothetical protein